MDAQSSTRQRLITILFRRREPFFGFFLSIVVAFYYTKPDHYCAYLLYEQACPVNVYMLVSVAGSGTQIAFGQAGQTMSTTVMM
jgi:hypothetical protein